MSCFKCYNGGGGKMKTQRLIGILSILLQKDRVTAPELAARFEVSRRTIQRDLEALSLAGIPIATRQGKHGGISIMDGYRLDRTALTSAEMQAILSGLRSLDSVSGTARYRQLMEKLSAGTADLISADESVLIDLASWYQSSLPEKFDTIQQAIHRRLLLQFTYCSPGGETERLVEPYFLVFQWSSWYLWAYCTTRADYRLFKLNRMTSLTLQAQGFVKRNVPLPDLRPERMFRHPVQIKVRFSPACKWRLQEEYGADALQVQEDGSLLFERAYGDRDTLFSWLLSFGWHAQLLEPESLRQELQEELERMCQIYR